MSFPAACVSPRPSSFAPKPASIAHGSLALALILLLSSALAPAAFAQVSLSASSLVWGTVAVGNTSGAKVLTLTNEGEAAVTLGSQVFSGAGGGDFFINTTSCAPSLAASASCTLSLMFRPTAAGSRTATLTLTDAASNSPQKISLSGTATGGSGGLTYSAASLAFGSVAVGSAGSSLVETLANGSGSAVSISSTAISGANAASFSIASNTCGSSLANAATCKVTVLFKSTAAGSFSANLVLTNSAPGSPKSIALSGTGTTTAAGGVTISPSPLTWGSVAVGNTSGSKPVTLTNTGKAAINISSIALAGADASDFLISSRTCGTSLAASASCTATLFFKPTAPGARTATLNFTDTAAGSPQSIAVSGAATGTAAGLTLSSSSLAFGTVTVGSSSSLTETVSNSSTTAISISSIAVSGANASDFTIASKTCGTSLAGSSSCAATIAFKPAATGARSATLTFTDSATGSPQKITLSGTGGSSAGVTLSSSSLAFGSVAVGGAGTSLTETLKTGTTAAVPISSIAVSGTNASDFTIASKSCGTSLAASASCTATILFKPAAAGSFSGTLTFTDSASTKTQTASLSGTGTTTTTPSSGTLTVTPASVAWGTLAVGTTGTQQVFTLKNTGTATVTLSNVAITSTDPGDFSVVSKSCGTSLGAGGSCTATVNFKPTAKGNRVALLSFTDSATGSPQTAEISGTGGALTSATPAITIDFGSRAKNQVVVPPAILGVEYMDSLPDSASKTTVVQAGIQSSRVHANVPTVFATTTPNWTTLDGSMKAFKAIGVHPILIIDQTPPWLVPNPVVCKSAPDTSVPSDLTKWGEMAASIIAHLDANFPGLVQDYEIWNEPNNTGALCADDKLDAYLDIYAAAAPLMKAQAKTDGATIRIGGPASAGVAWPTLLTDARTAPYVDFYSYHLYLSTPTDINSGMSWTGAGGKPSLMSMILSSSSGEQVRYKTAYSYVKAAKTPLGAKTPIYFSEFNDNWAFQADCCRNDPTYAPLFNAMVVAQVFNSVYNGAPAIPSKMMYYAAAQKPFCIMGVANAAMDCTPGSSNAAMTPYPQLYTFQMISSPSYLDLVDGGYMATSVKLSSAASAQGLIATAYYTATKDSILIINPTATSFADVTIQASNPGLSSPSASLYTVNLANRKLSSWPASLFAVSGGSQATIDIPPFSVLAIALRQ